MIKKPAIVCVDDEKIVLDSLRKELRTAFQNDVLVDIAESGEEALELILEHHHDGREVPIIISDYIMPGMKGDDLLREVKKIFPNIYSILLTGQATTEGVGNAVNWGGLYRYISKPWDSTDLELTIREAFKSYNKDKEIEQKRLELEIAHEKLKKLDNAKSYFLGLMSHELNTPLNAIYGNAQLITAFTDDEEVLESAEQIIIASNRLRKFNDLSLMITRIRTEKYDMSYCRATIKEIVDSAIMKQATIIKEKNAIIDNKIENLELSINCDEQLIIKAIELVINNSVKFADNQPLIDLTDRLEDHFYTIIITDNGPGFNESDLGTIFDLFSSDDLMHHTEGMGLGLSAAKLIMEAHNGEIIAYNNSNGVGAIVELKFNSAMYN